jgi:hypothetical protein
MGILRKEAVSWMDRVNVSDFRGANDPVDPQVAFAAWGLADADRFVG